MIRRSFIFCLLASAAPMLAQAGDILAFPDGTIRDFAEATPAERLLLPVGPYQNGKIDTATAEGPVLREVWKTVNPKVETARLIAPLRSQLEDAGYSILYECETRDCGGFDFRFKADVVDEPMMHVDLGDYRYLAATKPDGDKASFIGLLVSRSPERGFIQVTRIGALPEGDTEVALSTKQPTADAADLAGDDGTLAAKLGLNGAAVLEGLEFVRGASDLSGEPSTALQELADFLKDNPDRKVILVGHTDASGSLAGNIALSRKRAAAVMQQLVDQYGVDAAQVSAEGIGYLAPRANNATPEGRDRNRRVEVVLTVGE
ncbi:MAG: OmpA family protein [Rhodobacteraceae bacterium]|nr:OmpA family protein [Paracoccaceae bacterium]